MDQPDNLMVVEGLMVVDGELDRARAWGHGLARQLAGPDAGVPVT